MGMSFDEAIESLENMKALVGANHFAIKMGIETMRKYQKIEQIYHMFNEVNDFPLAMWNIGGVLDGNGVSEVRI